MNMRRNLIFTLFALVLAGSLVLASGQAQAAEKKEGPTQFFGQLIYRTGPFALKASLSEL